MTPVTVPLLQNVTHAPKDSSSLTMDTLVLKFVIPNSTETQTPENVKYVMDHAAHVMDQSLLTVHLAVPIPICLELNV